jgi:hypothetical protein
VSTFYVLPPRPLPARAYTDFLRGVLPGLNLARVTWGELAETLSEMLRSQDDVYLIHREDLPEGEDTAAALVNGFGAGAGDEVIEVGRTLAGPVRRWRMGQAA